MYKKDSTVVTVLSTADFDNPIWTNKQHLASGLAATSKVYYINSLGLRSPRLNKADIQRILRRLRSSVADGPSDKGKSPQEPSVHVLSPRILPFHGIALVQRINSYLLSRFVRKHIPAAERDMLWTFSPVTYGIEEHFASTIYHSVDLLHTFAHTPAKQILDAEKVIASRASHIIASSQGVSDHLHKHTGRASVLWENVADTQLYSANLNADPKHRAIFSGNLTPTKLDFEILFHLADNDIPLAIAGPIAIDGTAPVAQVQRLLSYRNVEYLGVLVPAALAREVANSKVGLVPYLVNTHTSGIFPMKVYEYLSAGLQVLCTPIGSLRSKKLPSGISIIDQNDFLSATKTALETYDRLEAQERSKGAMPYSWVNRISAARTLIDECVVGASTRAADNDG
ncbi:glycosyltransferase family 1 protein [Pseudarthrobacter sp. B4EP4b]|uniref:glycosyltransferase family 1 protein n=1 Tax=Pseudarthrobacter sp. B4EP4b TaxID=2590664 RepID=UPI00114DF2CC|nr:glycosyltransferase family 1 protein [Pseudarthrobacter sp. B4EP4b]